MAQSVGAIALDIVMGQNTVSSVARQAMQDVRQTFNNASATIKDKVSSVGTACKNLGASLAPVSAAATGVIKKTTDAAMAFETAMAKVKTIAGNASVSYKGSMLDMSQAILKLSTDSGMAAEDVAEATYSAISAGVDTAKSVEFVATANALAVGGFTDMATSVDVLTTTMNAYGEKAGTAQSISDKLITTQNLGKVTVNELASSMGKVIPTASAYGISIDNLCASYVAMTKGGIATAESTTYMKSMFNELANSGSEVGKILQEKTGKSFGQLMNEGKSLADVIDILGKSVDGDSEKFAQLWGSSEAGTGALAILNGGTEDYNNTLVEMGKSTGAASSAMDKMNNTGAHNMQVAMNNLKNAAIELGGAFAPVISKIAGVIGELANKFSNLSEPVKTTISIILGVVAVASPLLMVIGTIISSVGSVIGIVGKIGSVIGSFIGFISGTVVPALGSFFAFLAANPIVLIIGAIIAVGALLITHWDEVKKIAAEVWQTIKDIIAAVWEAIKTIIETVINIIKTIIETVFNAIKTVIEFYVNAWKTIITTVWNVIKTVVTTVVNAIKTVIETVFNVIKTVIETVCNVIKTVITTVWNGIKTAITTVVNAIKSVVTSVWNGIKSVTTTIWNGISNGISSVWNGIKNGVSSAVGAVKDVIVSGLSKAWDYITSIPSKALQWGKDIIMGIVDGIKGAIGWVTDAVSDVADTIFGWLHFSRPDVGPLHYYEEWMPDFMQGMASGINKNKYRVIDEVKSLANEMTPMLSSNLSMQAPSLKNVSNTSAGQTTNEDNKLYSLLIQLISKMDNKSDTIIDVYLGNDLIDEQIIKANNRRTVRSGGRA